jgi:hypothetical protein
MAFGPDLDADAREVGRLVEFLEFPGGEVVREAVVSCEDGMGR